MAPPAAEAAASSPIQQNRLLLARLPHSTSLPYDRAPVTLETHMPFTLPRLSALILLGLANPATLSTKAAAQAFPDKPIRFFVPFPAGGSTDAVARAMQPALEKIFRQPVVVENRSGGGGMLGVDAVAKAAPDGHTIGLAGAGA